MRLPQIIASQRSRTIKFLGTTSLIFGLLVVGTHRDAALSQGALLSAPKSTQSHQSHQSQTKAEEPQVAGMRILYVYEYTTAGSAYVEKVVLLFDDGSFTTDFSTLVEGVNTPAGGGRIATSRQENPRKWGVWRTDPENDFMYKFSYQSEWRDNTAISSLPMTTDRRLTGCYTAQSTSNAALSFGTFCFTDNGYFLSGANESRRGGGYIINGPFIALKYLDDNTLIINYIGIYSSDQQISINGAVYTKQN